MHFDTIRPTTFLYCRGQVGSAAESSVLDAAEGGKFLVIQQSLANVKLPISFYSTTGITPLMLVSLKGDLKSFEIVLNNSSPENLHMVDITGRNALHYACAAKDNKIDLKKIEALFTKFKLKILKDSEGLCAAEYVNRSYPEIHNLIGKATQDYLDNEAIIITSLYKKANGDMDKMNKIATTLGLSFHITARSINEHKCFDGDISPAVHQKIAQLKKERKLTREIQIEIVKHFIANPPKTVEKAIGYVWENYGVRVKTESMQKFLDYASQKRSKTEAPK